MFLCKQRITNNLGQLVTNASAANRQQIRQNIAATQQTGQQELFGGLRSGTRMQIHREANPELTQLRNQLSDNKRGKLQLSDSQKSAINKRIDELVAENKAKRETGEGAKLGRPPGVQAARPRSDKGKPRKKKI